MSLSFLRGAGTILFSLFFSYKLAVFPLLLPEGERVSERPVDSRVTILQSFLASHNSELVGHADFLVSQADTYDIPWTLVSAIAGVESTFCKRIPYKSYNCWGWQNGETRFRDYPQAITTVSRTIRRLYFNRGRVTPERMAPVYAPPSSTWGRNVTFFMRQIEQHTPYPNLALQNF